MKDNIIVLDVLAIVRGYGLVPPKYRGGTRPKGVHMRHTYSDTCLACSLEHRYEIRNK